MFGLWNNRSKANRHEPRVHQRSDRQGNVWWDIYDPATGQLTRVATEEEARFHVNSLH